MVSAFDLVQSGLTILTVSPLIAIGKLMKLEYFCMICCTSVFSKNFLCSYLICMMIFVPLVKESSSTDSMLNVPEPSELHLCAVFPYYFEMTSTWSETMKEE